MRTEYTPIPDAPAPHGGGAPVTAVAAHYMLVMWSFTYACGFEGPSADYERATLCPQCDAPWG